MKSPSSGCKTASSTARTSARSVAVHTVGLFVERDLDVSGGKGQGEGRHVDVGDAVRQAGHVEQQLGTPGVALHSLCSLCT